MCSTGTDAGAWKGGARPGTSIWLLPWLIAAIAVKMSGFPCLDGGGRFADLVSGCGREGEVGVTERRGC